MNGGRVIPNDRDQVQAADLEGRQRAADVPADQELTRRDLFHLTVGVAEELAPREA